MHPQIWTPPLAEAGLDLTTWPSGWGYAVLPKRDLDDGLIVVGEPLRRSATYDEFRQFPTVAERDMAQQWWSHAVLVAASVGGGLRHGPYLYGNKDRYATLTPWAILPSNWLLGPQADALHRLVAKFTDDERAYFWRPFTRALAELKLPEAVQALVKGLSVQERAEADRCMSAAKRGGAVRLGVNHAERLLYGFSDVRMMRSVESFFSEVDSGRYGNRLRDAMMMAADTAIRCLILRDVLSADTYDRIARAWFDTYGWRLHPDDPYKN